MALARRDQEVYERDSFLRMCGEMREWGELTNHVVMDVGCGDGRSCNAILKLFPKVRHIVGIDYDKQKLELAKALNPEKILIEYKYADILRRSTVARWEDQINKVISIDCLQHVDDQKTAFRHIYNILRDHGEAAILFSVKSGFFDWFTEITSHPKWKKFTKGICTQSPESHRKDFDASHYKELLEEIGFDIILCQTKKCRYTYENEVHLKTSMYASCPMAENVPSELIEEFQIDLYKAFLVHNKKDEQGRPTVWNTNIQILVEKIRPGPGMPSTAV